MDINEIKQELARRGWSQEDLAQKLGYNSGSIRKILCGARPLTESTAKHIELLFASTRRVVFVTSVDIPEGRCRSWVPGWDELSAREKGKALKAAVKELIQKYAQRGYEAMTPEDRAALDAQPGADPFDAVSVIERVEPARGYDGDGERVYEAAEDTPFA